MDYFDRFDKVLENNFHGDYRAMKDSGYRFDSLQGLPLRIVEIDRRPKKEPVYVTTPDVQLDDVIILPAEEPTNKNEELDFEVIDLSAEMDRRRKNTGTDNPVQPEPVSENADLKPLVLSVRQATKPSSRGAAIQTQTSKAAKDKHLASGGNRAQRRAIKAISRKDGKTANKGPRENSDRDNRSSQEADAPKRVSLSELDFGFRLE
ncbi:hypothetical protein MZD04_gp171 [Pseudomonas phage Psa21]|uniref:Uncharacterized protein n=1 Tax=Pseudomonas phage Psa21 TaxID=2530023 RepID=A0A481W4V7_9CAUD|nr:hypothetical protein MZD04_gp171 [Pseudomonas phage Psa21]QBJ02698.1 hypothetical protein PSA21_171 [Pseudomonas phage Psa21]